MSVLVRGFLVLKEGAVSAVLHGACSYHRHAGGLSGRPTYHGCFIPTYGLSPWWMKIPYRAPRAGIPAVATYPSSKGLIRKAQTCHICRVLCCCKNRPVLPTQRDASYRWPDGYSHSTKVPPCWHHQRQGRVGGQRQLPDRSTC